MPPAGQVVSLAPDGDTVPLLSFLKKSGYTGWGQVPSLMPLPVTGQAGRHSQAPGTGQRRTGSGPYFAPIYPE